MVIYIYFNNIEKNVKSKSSLILRYQVNEMVIIILPLILDTQITSLTDLYSIIWWRFIIIPLKVSMMVVTLNGTYITSLTITLILSPLSHFLFIWISFKRRKFKWKSGINILSWILVYFTLDSRILSLLSIGKNVH